MSRTVLIDKVGGPDVLKIRDSEIIAPRNLEVRIKVKTIGLNRAESMYRSGAYIEDLIAPGKIGYEASGIIESIGSNVSGFEVGDAVSVIPGFSFHDYGMYGELVLAPAKKVVKHSPSLTFEEAASIWMMFGTAYDGLISNAQITERDTVVIPAASSSVGLAAIQMSNMIGATSIALTRTADKRERLLKAGAHHVIVTEEKNLVDEILKITNQKGATVVFDPVGGATFAKLIAAAAQEAKILVYGALSEEPTVLPMIEMLAKRPTISVSRISSTTNKPEGQKQLVDFINKGLLSGQLKPVIDRVFPFDQIVKAHEYLEGNQQFGKILVKVED